MTSQQRTGLLKECFYRYGEKLGWISRSIGIEQRWYTALVSSTERRKLGSHHVSPGCLLFARRQTWHSVNCVIFKVELVSKLVEDNVLTIGGISCAMFDCAPGQNQGAHPTAGLAKAMHSPLF